MPTINTALIKNNEDETQTNYKLQMPEEWCRGHDRKIIINEIRALFGHTDEPFDHLLNNVCLYSDFPREGQVRGIHAQDLSDGFHAQMWYVALANSQNGPKEFDILETESRRSFLFAFANLDGTPIVPTQWLVDLSLSYK
jgi:hypothetical protein